jgi:hypothetical protein
VAVEQDDNAQRHKSLVETRGVHRIDQPRTFPGGEGVARTLCAPFGMGDSRESALEALEGWGNSGVACV